MITKSFPINKLVIIGVGLIGGSLGLALSGAAKVSQIMGYGRNANHLARARELGAIDNWSTDLRIALTDADMIMIATPLSATPNLFSDIKRNIDSDCVITDAGSAKGNIVEAGRNLLGDLFCNFVPGHPIAGLEKSGVEAATRELFVGHNVILTPVNETKARPLESVTSLWAQTGANLMTMSPEQHDQILALTSHLPHIIAYSLVSLLSKNATTDPEVFELAAGGFYDISRIASSSPIMWRDICLDNSEQLLSQIENYRDMIDRFASLIRLGDAKSLEAMFEDARLAREKIGERR
tara:strand:- start:2031 stop:2915 length:885 start_codon:yes stop_codon:yes gene_type:complete